MAPVLRHLRSVAYEALSLLKPDDEVALFDFAARTDRIQDLTTDRRRIATRIGMIHAGGATVIPDALYESAAYLAAEAKNRRHAIILISDNANTLEGYATDRRVIREALESEAAIYSICVEGGAHPRLMNVLLPIFRESSVEQMARETGGEVINAESTRSIRTALIAAITRLRQRYSLGYYASNRDRPDAFRQLEIRVDNRRNPNRRYNVYARRGYYARTEQAISSADQP
jgi:VWFA-related protein